MRTLGVVIASFFLSAVSAGAKEFPPGSLMICGATQCRTVADVDQSWAFSSLVFADGPVRLAPTPRIGSPIYQLRFKSGRPAGAIISATAIRVHGLSCGRFRREKWYRLPRVLRGITRGLEPKLLRASIPRSC